VVGYLTSGSLLGVSFTPTLDESGNEMAHT